MSTNPILQLKTLIEDRLFTITEEKDSILTGERRRDDLGHHIIELNWIHTLVEKCFPSMDKPSNQVQSPNTLLPTPKPYLPTNVTNEKWLQSLALNDGLYFIPGQTTCMRPKALAFQIQGRNQIWIPLSVVDQGKTSVSGIYVKQWWVEKNLDKVGGY